jgi:hypothetical protein
MRESGGGPDARRPLCFPTFRGSLRLLELALALAPVVLVELLDETGPEDTERRDQHVELVHCRRLTRPNHSGS